MIMRPAKSNGTGLNVFLAGFCWWRGRNRPLNNDRFNLFRFCFDHGAGAWGPGVSFLGVLIIWSILSKTTGMSSLLNALKYSPSVFTAMV